MRAKKNILNDVRGINPGQTDLITEVWEYCIKNDVDPAEEFWDEIADKRLDALGSDDLELMSNRPSSQSSGGKMSAEDRQKLAEEFVEPFYKLGVSKRGVTTYRIDDKKDQVLKEIDNDAEEIMIGETLLRMEEEYSGKVEEGLASSIVARFRMACPRVGVVPPFLMPDEPGWTTFRPDYVPEESQKDNIPNWISVLDRMSDGDAFAAWIWGVYSGDYGGRSILWLYGSKGEEGKSTISSLLGEKLFGGSAYTIGRSVLGKENKFLNSFFEGSRLILYPDCNITTLLMMEAFKSLASGGADKVLVEHKGKRAYTASIDAYAWVCSNKKPTIENKGPVLSRLLYIKIDPFDGPPTTMKESQKILEAEIPGFLAYARDRYEELCEDNYCINVNDKTKSMVRKLVEGANSEFDDIFDKYYSKNPGSKVRNDVMVRTMSKEGLSTKDFGRDKFIEYLEREHDCYKEKDSRGSYYSNIERKKSNVVQFKAKDKKSEDAF